MDLTPSVWEEGEEAAAEVGEFLGAETTAWLKKQGIQRELTTAYTPQSNGVAERANRTILETARALLIESGVGDSMWPHAVRHATVARNRVLTKSPTFPRSIEIGLLKLIIGEEPRPSDPALQQHWDERASAGYYLMSQNLELNQRHHVMHLLPEVDCGPKAWTVLKELHAPTSVVATLMLERELSALRLSEGEPVQHVLDKMRDLYANLATAEITYPEQTKCLKMLSLLPESWLQFTSRLSLPQNQSLWTLEWVRTKILEDDFRRRQLRGGDDGSSGYGMQGSKRGRGCGFGGAGRGAKKDDDSNDQQGGTGWGRGAKSGRGGKSGAGGKMKGSCRYYEKEGHPWFLSYKKPLEETAGD
ncbi:unnamed protein product [Closterium sp. NIES-53]